MDQVKEIAIEMKKALLRGDLDRFGDMLQRGLDPKEKDGKGITTPRIDEALRGSGKAGPSEAKSPGQGVAVILMLYCPFNKRHIVRERL